MPYAMIHFLVARAVEPGASPAFWVGNVAPDYASERELKDRIHLLGGGDRWAALAGLRDKLDIANPFERGWLLHLFTDARWEDGLFLSYRNWAETVGYGEGWFAGYREESNLATCHLYHSLPWAKRVMDAISSFDLHSVETSLPISRAECAWYLDRVVRRHKESDPACMPRFFSAALPAAFAGETALKYREWMDQMQ